MNKTESNLLIQEIELSDSLKRIDVYLSEIFPDFSRNRIQGLIKDGKSVLINGFPTKTSYKLKYKDKLNVELPESTPLELEAQDLGVEIVFENDDMLVVNKPTGMLTHPSKHEHKDTLVNALLFHCGNSLSGINGIMRPGIVHRLDKDTSGLLMVAKNDFAHNHLSMQIKEKTAIRKYLTIVKGNLKEDSGIINASIDRHPNESCKMKIMEGGKNAVTHWKVLERFGEYTFIEVELKTGRTHQIRVHFSHINHPVYGDTMYGGSKVKVKTQGQILQSYKLMFTNPADNEIISLEIEHDREITKVLNYLRSIK